MSGSDRLTDRATRACRGQAVGAHVCAVSSLGRYVGVMTSETLARAGTLGRLVVPEERGGLETRHDGVWVSTALTLTRIGTAHRRRNRRIPTIPAERADAGLANVSTVDTRPRRSESPWFVRHSPAPPSQVRPHRPLPVACAGARWSWFNSGPAQNWLEWARVDLLHEGRDPLAKGCVYCTKAPPTRSTPTPPPVAPHLRAVHPDDAGSHHSDQGAPLRQAEAATLPSGRRAPPVS